MRDVPMPENEIVRERCRWELVGVSPSGSPELGSLDPGAPCNTSKREGETTGYEMVRERCRWELVGVSPPGSEECGSSDPAAPCKTSNR